MIQNDLTDEDRKMVQGYVVATDAALSGWGKATGRSIVARPFRTMEECDTIKDRFDARSEFKRVRIVAKTWWPRLANGDHLQVMGFEKERTGT